MAAGKAVDKDNRIHSLRIRMSDEEKAKLEGLAKDNGLTLSAMVRFLIASNARRRAK